MLKLDVRSPASNQEFDESCLTSSSKWNYAVAAIPVVLVLLFFGKTVFFGQPISQIANLQDWDSLYSAYWRGNSKGCDPSIVQLIVPYYFVVANIWHSLSIPLWNQYSAFGTPLLADIQASVFSPVRALFFLFPTMTTYNLTLVGEVVLAAAGTFALVRSLSLSRYAAVFAALAYALCPYNIHYLEQTSGASHCLYPIVFYLFVRMAKQGSLLNCSLCGLGGAAFILSGHPESSFFGIGFASLLTLLIGGINGGSWAAGNFIRAVRSLCIAGAITFCVAAPVLLPFIEYLTNSDSYKFSIGGSTWVPWQGILYNLLQPGFKGASPFLSIVTAMVLPFAVVRAVKLKGPLLAVLITAVVCGAITARLGFINGLFLTPPLNTLITLYCLPIFLLLTCVVAGCGIDGMLEPKRSVLRPLLLVLGAGAAVAVPMVLVATGASLKVGDFDMMIPHMSVDVRQMWQQLGLLGGLAMVYGLTKLEPKLPPSLLPIALLVVTFASQAHVAKYSLPVQPKFDYPQCEPIAFLKEESARVVAIGNHLLRPNTNAVYGVSDICTHNPLFPARNLEFLKASGAEVDMFNQVFQHDGNKLLDLAGVGYLLSVKPVDGPNLSLVMRTAQGIYVYRRTKSIGTAHLVHRVRRAAPADMLALMCAENFDPASEALVESDYSLSPARTIDDDSVHQDAEPSGNLTFRTTSDSPSLLVVNHAYYPGWKAFVDGAETQILRTNYLFRGVPVEAGDHVVRFEYHPESFAAGIAIFSCGLGLLSILVVLRRRRV